MSCDDENTEEAHLCVAVNAAEERRGFWIDAIIQGKRERSTPGHFMPSSRPIVATNDRCSFARRTEERNEEHKKTRQALLPALMSDDDVMNRTNESSYAYIRVPRRTCTVPYAICYAICHAKNANQHQSTMAGSSKRQSAGGCCAAKACKICGLLGMQ